MDSPKDGLETFNPLHRFLHKSVPGEPPTDKNGVRIGVLKPTIKRKARCPSFDIKLDMTDGTGLIRRKLYDYLHGISIHYRIPRIKIDPKYAKTLRFRRSPNPAHHLNISTLISCDTEKIFDTSTMVAEDFYAKNIKNRKLYDEGIGNKPGFNEWCSEMDSDELIYPLVSLGFHNQEEDNPDKSVLLCRFHSDLKVEMINQTNPLAILEVQELKETQWRFCKPKKSWFIIDKPIEYDVWLRVGIGDKESIDKFIKDQTFAVIYREATVIKSDNRVKEGKTHTCEIPCDTSTVAVSWMCQSSTAIKYNLLSNYTTNCLAEKEGLNPTKSSYWTGIPYLKGIKYPSHVTEVLNSFRYGLDPILKRGINTIAFGNHPFANKIDTGIGYSGVSLKVKLRSRNRSHHESREGTEEDILEDRDISSITSSMISKDADIIAEKMLAEYTDKQSNPTIHRTNFCTDGREKYVVYIIVYRLVVLYYHSKTVKVYRDGSVIDYHKLKTL